MIKAARGRWGERRGQQGERELDERSTYTMIWKGRRQEPRSKGAQGMAYEWVKRGRQDKRARQV